ncbi:fibronectin type III domain protein [Cooperia oncophora]
MNSYCDPDLFVPLEVAVMFISTAAIPKYCWTSYGQRIQHDHTFYTVTTTTLNDDNLSSVLKMKSSTRSDNLTCVAVNPAGQVARSVSVQIRGPGSPPSTVTVQSERGGYTVSWLPPSHPNGTSQVLAKSEEAFYVRVQAAADSGPGVISDIVAIEKDTIPITVSLEYTSPPGREHLLVESWEKINVRCVARGKPRPLLFYVLTEVGEDPEAEINVRCVARGKPRPLLFYVLTEVGEDPEAEEDIWHLLDVQVERDSIVGEVEFSTFTSKTLHCKAKNTAGSNSSSLTFIVKKPGDPPRDIQVLSIDSRDVIIVWKAPKYPNMKIESYELLLSDDVEEDEEYWQKYRTAIRNDCLASDKRTMKSSLPTDQLKPSYDYYVKVRAINEAGAGPLSEAIHFTTPNGGPEHPPTGVSVEINEANIAVVRWNPPNSTTEILVSGLF